MSIMNKTPILPVFDGEKSRTDYRRLAARVDDDFGFRTVIQNNPDGSTTMLRTRGGMPEVTNTSPTASVSDSTIQRGLCVSVSIPETKAKIVYCNNINGPFVEHTKPPTIMSATDYYVVPSKPLVFPSEVRPGKDFYDVLNVDSGKLWKSANLVRTLPSVSGIPVVILGPSGKLIPGADDADDYHLFFVQGSATHLSGRKTGTDVVVKPHGYIDGVDEDHYLSFGGNVSVFDSRVSWYGDFSFILSTSGYAYDVALSASAPYITESRKEKYQKKWPSVYECDPTADASVSNNPTSMVTPSGVPGNAKAFVWSKRFELHEGPYDGADSGYSGTDWWSDNSVPMPTISAPVVPSSGNAYLSLYSGGKGESMRRGNPNIGGVQFPIDVDWNTSFEYSLRTQNGSWSAISQGSIPYCIGRSPWLSTYQQYPLGDPTVGDGPTVAIGTSYAINGVSSLSLNAMAGDIPLVSITGECTVWRDHFSGSISQGAPLHEAEHAARTTHSTSHYALYDAITMLPRYSASDGPLREWFYVEVLGVDGHGYDRTVWSSEENDEIRRTRALSVSARDYIFHDPHNDISIWLEFSGSGNIDQGTSFLVLRLSAKGSEFSEAIGSQTDSDGVRLGVEVMRVGNYDPGAEWFPVPEIPCVFAPPSEQGLVDYLCYTTSEEESAGVIPQFLISLRLWIRNPWLGADEDEPDAPPSVISVMPENIYPSARCVGGGAEVMSDAEYKLMHFRFSNEGVSNFDDRLWPETTGLDKTIKCWRI